MFMLHGCLVQYSLKKSIGAFLTGKITQQEFEQYLWDKVHTCCSDWLEKNKEKIGK